MKLHAVILITRRHLAAVLLLTLCIAPVSAQENSKPAKARQKPRSTRTGKYDASVPEPTAAGVRYGNHERHILDFWKAESTTPAPLVFIIHGGGWQGGSKERAQRFADVAALLKARIPVAAINTGSEADERMAPQQPVWRTCIRFAGVREVSGRA